MARLYLDPGDRGRAVTTCPRLCRLIVGYWLRGRGIPRRRQPGRGAHASPAPCLGLAGTVHDRKRSAAMSAPAARTPKALAAWAEFAALADFLRKYVSGGALVRRLYPPA